MARKNSKIIRYRRPLKINAGMIIFIIFFIYLLYNLLAYATRTHVQIYEVGQISSVVKDNTYSGLILRDETVFNSEASGYVNYYVRSSSRTGVGNTVYSIDKDGSYTNQLMKGTTGSSTFSEDQLDAVKKKLTAFSAGYNQSQFQQVYNMKYNVENMILNYLSSETLGQLEDLNSTGLKAVAAEQSGIVEYYKDGFETKTEEELKAADFDQTTYSNHPVSSGTMLSKGDFVYKVVNSETWYIYLPLNETDINALADTTKVYLHFNDVNLDAGADFTLIKTKDGTVLGKCTLARYMNQLADRRYASVTLLNSRMNGEKKDGLKIPKTSVVKKSFYKIPEEFATKGKNSSKICFLAQVSTKSGSRDQLLTLDIYALIDGYYYVDMNGVEAGTVLKRTEKSLEQLEAELEGTELPEEEETEETEEIETETETESQTESQTETTSEEASTETASEETSGEVETSAAETEEETPKVFSNLYEISETGELQGALCVNKGYCVFKQISILDEADDYFIVANGQDYGLAVYDHILLDGTSAKEGDILYQ